MLALVAVAGQAQRIDSVPEMACKRFEVPAVPATTSHQACVTTAQFLILSPPVAEGLHPIIRGSHAVQPVLPRALSRSVMDRLKRNPLFQVAHEPHSSTEELSKRILDVSNSLPIDEDESQEMGKAGKQEAEEDNEILIRTLKERSHQFQDKAKLNRLCSKAVEEQSKNTKTAFQSVLSQDPPPKKLVDKVTVAKTAKAQANSKPPATAAAVAVADSKKQQTPVEEESTDISLASTGSAAGSSTAESGSNMLDPFEPSQANHFPLNQGNINSSH
eukprot:scpid69262/ scgid1206/ 